MSQTTTNRQYNATTNVNVRTGPGTSYSNIATLPAGGGQLLFYNYTVSADGYNWVADYDCDNNVAVVSNGYYVCAKEWTVLSYYQ